MSYEPRHPRATQVTLDLLKEFDRALQKHPRMHASLHESYAVLLEEVDELWDAVRGDDEDQHIEAEALQVAVSAVRLIVENRLRREMQPGGNAE